MNSISISQLKMNPSAAIELASDYPLEVMSRGKSKAYLVGNKLFEKMVEFMEDVEDRKMVDEAIKSGELGKGRDFEEFAKELGL
ncbi:MAG: type II toxin-antitoxin system Phd/YefM family antitoxin [bacterium]